MAAPSAEHLAASKAVRSVHLLADQTDDHLVDYLVVELAAWMAAPMVDQTVGHSAE